MSPRRTFSILVRTLPLPLCVHNKTCVRSEAKQAVLTLAARLAI